MNRPHWNNRRLTIKRVNRRIVDVLYFIMKDVWKKLEIKDALLNIILKKGDIRDFGNNRSISFLSIAKKVFAHIQLNRPSILADYFFFFTWGTIWVPYKPRSHGHDLLAINTGEIRWKEYVPLHDICRFHKSLRYCHKVSTVEHLTDTRVPWTVCLASICFAHSNNGISQLKRRTLGTIWG